MRLINFPYLYNFSLESEQISSYSHSCRAGARKDTEREVCARSHRIHSSVKRGCRRSTCHIGPTSQKIQYFKTRKPGFV